MKLVSEIKERFVNDMDPQTVLDIQWRDEFQPVLDKLNKVLQAGVNKNTYFYARALLKMLREGRTNAITTMAVASKVYRDDAPRGGWVTWDWTKWCNYGRPVVVALKSNNPMSVLKV